MKRKATPLSSGAAYVAIEQERFVLDTLIRVTLRRVLTYIEQQRQRHYTSIGNRRNSMDFVTEILVLPLTATPLHPFVFVVGRFVFFPGGRSSSTSSVLR